MEKSLQELNSIWQVGIVLSVPSVLAMFNDWHYRQWTSGEFSVHYVATYKANLLICALTLF